MDALPDFALKRPTSLDEAAALLSRHPGARLHAGGTDLIPNLRRGLERPTMLIDLGALRDFSQIESSATELVLGAGVTLARLGSDERIGSCWPAIGEAASCAAGPGHRTVATLGGNLCLDTRCVFYNQSEWWRAANQWCLKRGGETCHVAPQGERCHAAFSGDLAPALIALGAEVELVSIRGRRRIALTDCYRDDGAAHLGIERDEILARVHVPAPATGLASGYRKARVRGAMDFPLAGVAAALILNGETIATLRIALTGTDSRPLLLAGTEALIDRRLDETTLGALGKLVQHQVAPMRTTATPANHRRQVAAVLTQRLVQELAARLRTASARTPADRA